MIKNTHKPTPPAMKLFFEMLGCSDFLDYEKDPKNYCLLGKFKPNEVAGSKPFLELIKKFTARVDEQIGGISYLPPNAPNQINEKIKKRIPTFEDFCEFLKEAKSKLYILDKPLSEQEWQAENIVDNEFIEPKPQFDKEIQNWWDKEVEAYIIEYENYIEGRHFDKDRWINWNDKTPMSGASQEQIDRRNGISTRKHINHEYYLRGYFKLNPYIDYVYRLFTIWDYVQGDNRRHVYNLLRNLDEPPQRPQRHHYSDRTSYHQRLDKFANAKRAYLEIKERYNNYVENLNREHLKQKENYKQKLQESKDHQKLEYKKYLRNFDSHSLNPQISRSLVYQFLEQNGIRLEDFLARCKPNLESYLYFLSRLSKKFSDRFKFFPYFLSQQNFYIHEKERESHTYIVAGSGGGKSELLKYIIHNYHDKPHKSLVIIDPHGLLCEQIARHSNFISSERLMFLDFGKTDFLLGFNPLQLPDRKPETINFYIQHISHALQEVFGELSVHMRTLVESCLSVLLRTENPTLRDLQLFMDDEQNKEFVELGKRHPNPALRDFFRKQFAVDSDFKRTKNSVSTRLASLFNHDRFLHTVNRANSFDLEKAINSGKIVLCNLSIDDLGVDISQTIGRLFVSQLNGIARRRGSIKDENKRPHTHLFIDECHLFLSGSMKEALEQLRKYKMILTLANQSLEQFDGKLRDSILSNANIKVLGKNSPATLHLMSETMGIASQETNFIQTGEFFVRVKNHNYPIRVKVPATYIKDKGAVSEQRWQAFLESQHKKYYIPFNSEAEQEQFSYSRKTQSVKDVYERERKSRKQGFQSKYDL